MDSDKLIISCFAGVVCLLIISIAYVNVVEIHAVESMTKSGFTSNEINCALNKSLSSCTIAGK